MSDLTDGLPGNEPQTEPAGTGKDATAERAPEAPGPAASTGCPNGHEVKAGAAFCGTCGARVGVEAAPTSGTGTPSAPPPSEPQVSPPGSPQPYSTTPPYGWAPTYAAPAAPQSTNGLAIASLVLGIVWIAGLGSLLALIFGVVSKRQIRDSGGRQGGGGMATAGIVLGIVGIVGAIIWIILIAVAVNQVDNCLNNPTQANCGNTGLNSNSGSSGTSNSGSTGSTGSTGTTGSTGSGLGSTGSSGVVLGLNVFALF
jgi:hypothetical protein